MELPDFSPVFPTCRGGSADVFKYMDQSLVLAVKVLVTTTGDARKKIHVSDLRDDTNSILRVGADCSL
jgi:hypothetical protein